MEMKIFFVDKPHQDSDTKNPQFIFGKRYSWTVNTERVGLNTTFQEWWKEKLKSINDFGQPELVDGIFLYDVEPVLVTKTDVALFIRYAWKNKETKN